MYAIFAFENKWHNFLYVINYEVMPGNWTFMLGFKKHIKEEVFWLLPKWFF